MAPKAEQGTIIILDVGRNVSVAEMKNEKSFFENARECTARIIERKILSQGKNLVGIILLGSKVTKNNMADQCEGAFRHIELYAELQTPTWQMIRDLPKLPSKSKGDWCDALVVAADHFKNGVSGVKILNTKIILMTNFQQPTQFEPKDIERVLNGFKEEKYEVDVIGPDIYSEDYISEDILLARKFIEVTNGATAMFDYTMQYLLFHKKRAVNALPWNADLCIGPDVRIPVSSYIRLKDEPVVKNWSVAVKDPVTSKASTSEGVIKNKVHINTDKQSVVEPDKVIKGYHYGQQIIPFSDCDRSMLYESGEKCLSVYGFTHASNIKWQNFNSDGLSYVFGRKGDKKAQYAIRCLVECLHELNLVAIARRVYNNNNAPKMYALLPVIDTNNYVCLSMTPLCYQDDIKYMAFPSINLKKYACSNEQVNAFKDLIKAMDLTKAYDEKFDNTEAFPIGETVSPCAQYILDCIAYRALNPGKPLPPPRDDIMSLFKIPPLIQKNAREPLDKLKKMFTLKKVEVKKRKPKSDMDADPLLLSSNPQQSTTLDSNISKILLPKKPTNDIDKIGTINPVDDFITLINKGKPFVDLALEMTEAIENLIYHNLDGNFSKAFDAMTYLRKECVKFDPTPYNNWIIKFKLALAEHKRNDILNIIHEKKLNLILKTENSSSTYDNEDSCGDSQLYEMDTQPNSVELTIRSDVNDMFDEM